MKTFIITITAFHMSPADMSRAMKLDTTRVKLTTTDHIYSFQAEHVAEATNNALLQHSANYGHICNQPFSITGINEQEAVPTYRLNRNCCDATGFTFTKGLLFEFKRKTAEGRNVLVEKTGQRRHLHCTDKKFQTFFDKVPNN